MIKECLKYLLETKLNIGIERIKVINELMNYYEDDQLYYIMQSYQGLIVEDMSFHYYPNIGFRCDNIDAMTIGRNPICNILQRKLNEQYKILLS